MWNYRSTFLGVGAKEHADFKCHRVLPLENVLTRDSGYLRSLFVFTGLERY